MAAKRETSDPWPVITGEYEVGNPENPVAVITCGSHISGKPFLDAGASIAGPCKTENIGIEKMVANVISNPNIRYIIVTGMEVKGHITGQAIVSFAKGGIDKEGRIVGAIGAIPFIQNLNQETIERFQQQVEIIEMIDTEDAGTISGKVRELVSKDPGAFDGDPMIVEIKEGAAEEEAHGLRPMAAEIANIRARMRAIDAAVTAIGLQNKHNAGIYAGKIEGFAIGMTLVLVLFGLIMRIGGM
ncbi:MAG: tetrahydromethanopterin S-methyltransferase subunit A [Methanotrichaceae archaeon]|nr:tetrahydromethanopterin S-methyltransferase subunit A [Methanotrichaceae archaeon]